MDPPAVKVRAGGGVTDGAVDPGLREALVVTTGPSRSSQEEPWGADA